MLPTDDLIRLATRWLATRGVAFDHLEPLAGDVSARRYARVALATGGTTVLAHYPPSLVEAGERYCRTTAILETAGVRVPAIHRWDADAGMMWLEDVGDRSLYDAAQSGRVVDPHRRRAVALAGRIAALAPAALGAINPRLDGVTLRSELEQSWHLVLLPNGLTGEGRLRRDLGLALDALCASLDEAPPGPCHRDFMARNLLLDAAEELTVIDHQDLRLGPPWYDLASLLNDSLYVTPEQEAKLLDLARVPPEERQAYHRAAAQRTLKIVGTFTAFARRGAPRHLQLVPPSLRAARRHLSLLSETGEVLRRLSDAWDRGIAATVEPA